jgi:hypothetical protein
MEECQSLYNVTEELPSKTEFGEYLDSFVDA